MSTMQAPLAYVLRLGDTALITAQRLIERVAGEPELEEELANANFSLDYLGQARLFYTYAGELEGNGRDEDDFAFRRDEREFRNLLIAEQPIGDFADKIARQFLFETFYLLQLEALTTCADPRLAEIAARAEKEIRYHHRHVSQWLVRLGDGTDESHTRAQASIDRFWRFTGEFFAGDEIDFAVSSDLAGPDLETLAPRWLAAVTEVLNEATLGAPENAPMASGSREGLHSEHLGYLIAEMQYLQRAHPGESW